MTELWSCTTDTALGVHHMSVRVCVYTNIDIRARGVKDLLVHERPSLQGMLGGKVSDETVGEELERLIKGLRRLLIRLDV
jgi:hypothetical protein